MKVFLALALSVVLPVSVAMGAAKTNRKPASTDVIRCAKVTAIEVTDSSGGKADIVGVDQGAKEKIYTYNQNSLGDSLIRLAYETDSFLCSCGEAKLMGQEVYFPQSGLYRVGKTLEIARAFGGSRCGAK